MAIAGLCIMAHAQNVARISMIEGKVSVLHPGGADWISCRPNMQLAIGDQIYTREESFAEITYTTGVLTRLAEKTKLTIVSATDKSVKTRSAVGEVWVNMRKLVTSSGKQFELATPTATAAIRGTVFQSSTHTDSSTDVSVFEGKVAVGPGDALKKPEGAKQPSSGAAVEVPGPEEVPGPYEVSLEEWKNIVAGQRISVRRDGKFAQEKFDPQKASEKEAFVKKNIALDAKAPADK
jgi:hypothetical protein